MINKLLKPFKFYRLKRKIKFFFFKKKKFNNDKEYLVELGKVRLGYKMNLDNPKTFNEKINWYKLNYRNELMPVCVDKYDVRKYIKEKKLENILLKNYGVYNSIDEIDLEKLPNEFVIKFTGDSGGVAICKDKTNFHKIIGDKFSNINSDYSSYNKEWVYHNIKNRLIVEELIKTPDGTAPKDYKFFCFNGEPKFLFVASEREKEVKFDFFDLNWNRLKLKQGHLNSKKEIKKPEKFEEMINICKILSKDFPHVRVDLYFENGKIYFGELTFFHFAGLTPFWPKKYDYIFGNMFDISRII